MHEAQYSLIIFCPADKRNLTNIYMPAQGGGMEIIMDNMVHEMQHPLIKHKISMIRSKDTQVKDFRELVYEIALLMGYEATRDLALKEAPFKLPSLRQQAILSTNRLHWFRFCAPVSEW